MKSNMNKKLNMKTKLKQKNKIKIQFIFNKNSKEYKFRFRHKNTYPDFLAFSCPFLSTKHKNTNTNPGTNLPCQPNTKATNTNPAL